MEIEKGFPVPQPSHGGRGHFSELRAVLSEMEVGDSVRACDHDDLRERKRWEVNVSRCRASTGHRFTVRRHEDHIRVWRIA